MNLLIFFIILSIVNVIGGTAKSIATIKGGVQLASIANALYFGFYTIVLIYIQCDLPLWEKVLITTVCNYLGVYIVKVIEKKRRKDQLWKIELTMPKATFGEEKDIFDNIKVPHNYIDIGKYVIMNFYCSSKEESEIVKDFMGFSGAKCFVSESKVL